MTGDDVYDPAFQPYYAWQKWRYLTYAQASWTGNGGAGVYTVAPADFANNEIRCTLSAGLNTAGDVKLGGWAIWPLTFGGKQPAQSGTNALPFMLEVQTVQVTNPGNATMVVAAAGITSRTTDLAAGNDWIVSGFNWQPAGVARSYMFQRFGGGMVNVAGSNTGTPVRGGLIFGNGNGTAIQRTDSMYFAAGTASAPSANIASNVGGNFSGAGPYNIILSFQSFGGAITVNSIVGVQVRYRGLFFPEAC